MSDFILDIEQCISKEIKRFVQFDYPCQSSFAEFRNKFITFLKERHATVRADITQENLCMVAIGICSWEDANNFKTLLYTNCKTYPKLISYSLCLLKEENYPFLQGFAPVFSTCNHVLHKKYKVVIKLLQQLNTDTFSRTMYERGRNLLIPLGNLDEEKFRLISYLAFPCRECPVKPDDLASAGFFYTGSKDEVECYICKRRNSNWTLLDDVRLTKWHDPDCRLLRSRLARSPMNGEISGNVKLASNSSGVSVQSPRRHPTSASQNSYDGSGTRTNLKSCYSARSGHTSGLNRPHRERRSTEDAAMVQAFQPATKVPRSEIDPRNAGRPVQEYNSSGASHSSKTSQKVQSNLNSTVSVAAVLKNVNQDQPIGPSCENPPVQATLRQLQQERLCKVCREDMAVMVFIPCGHVCTCRSCGKDIKYCLVCDMEVAIPLQKLS